eukprot:m.199285 g.199285  ORF g.199285 m.199285 type:complete len:498 (-) comp20703_c0_seq1:87-1580(-)
MSPGLCTHRPVCPRSSHVMLALCLGWTALLLRHSLLESTQSDALSLAQGRVAELERRMSRMSHHCNRTCTQPGDVGGRVRAHTQLPVNSSLLPVNFSLFELDSLESWQPHNSQLPRTFVVVGVISSQSDHSAKQRHLIRSTWLAHSRASIPPSDMQIRFFVGGNDANTGSTTPHVKREMAHHGDVIVLDVPDSYGGLITKVQRAMQWTLAHYRADFFAKFDDDCYVSPRGLLTELESLPLERVYWGKMVGGSKVQRRSGNRNSEPNLPPGVDWFPPYASGGAGYALSWDLVHVVAYPSVKRLDMVNEDGYLGIVLLPYDVDRRSSNKLHAYGIMRGHGGCTLAENIVSVHYVKDKGDHDCMAAIHHNMTAGQPVCESRYCGPINCNFTFPWPTGKVYGKRCVDKARSLALPAKWTVIDPHKSCEVNEENVKRFFAARRMRDLSCCQRLCEELCSCKAIDYYENTAWCNLYTKPCTTPRKGTEGASSYRIDQQPATTM